MDEAADPRDDAAEGCDLPHDGPPCSHRGPRAVSLADLPNILDDGKFGEDEDDWLTIQLVQDDGGESIEVDANIRMLFFCQLRCTFGYLEYSAPRSTCVGVYTGVGSNNGRGSEP